jgi:hypothetical protein
VQRQAVPGGCAHLVKRHLGLGHVHVTHGAVHAQESAHQALRPALALQVFQQRQQGAFTGVQRDEVEEVKHPWLVQLTQFGVDKAAAQHGGDVWVRGLEGLRDAKGRVHRAGEGHAQQHHRGLVLFDGGQRQRLQRPVHQVQGRGQGLRQRVEVGWLAAMLSA